MSRADAESEVVAPAKLTLSLRVTGTRPDGYHLIEAEMFTLDLHDTLTFQRSPGGTSSLKVVGGRCSGIPVDDGNLVARALSAVGRSASVTLVKRIPAGAGLGGGSADAAAVLRWAGCDDPGVAGSLGADVPFCLVGGRAIVTGVGEELRLVPMGDMDGRELTILTPPFGVSTPAVYAEWDRLGGPRSEGSNDLEPAALAIEPRLASYRDRLGEASGLQPALAGSGSSWFVPGAFEVAGLECRVTRAKSWTGELWPSHPD